MLLWHYLRVREGQNFGSSSLTEKFVLLITPLSTTMQKSHSLRWRLAQWLEIRWWKRYLNPQDKKTYYRNKAQYWHRVLQELEFQVPTQQQILEIGCGPAGIFIILEGNQLRALDPLLNAYQAKLTHFSKEDYPWVQFENQALETASGPARPLVFCFNAINHIADWELGLDQLWRLTAEGGQLVLSSDVHRHHWLKHIFRWLPGDALHPQQHSREDYLSALRKKGWKIKKECILKKGLIFEYWFVLLEKHTVT